MLRQDARFRGKQPTSVHVMRKPLRVLPSGNSRLPTVTCDVMQTLAPVTLALRKLAWCLRSDI